VREDVCAECARYLTDASTITGSRDILTSEGSWQKFLWFCVVIGPKPPLHRQNWLSFGKFQNAETFLVLCPRHVFSRLPPSSKTWKYTMVRITHTDMERFFTHWYDPFCYVSVGCCATKLGNSGGTYELSCMVILAHACYRKKVCSHNLMLHQIECFVLEFLFVY
jgi:hypothetical protein